MQCGAYCCAAHHADCTVLGILLQDFVQSSNPSTCLSSTEGPESNG
ncbi:hypothetical protein T4A_5416, partial [Trichinella pseudospiralis]